MLSAICIYCAVCCWLRILRRNRYGRWALFTIAGTTTTGIGVGLYYAEVSGLDLNKFVMRPVNWPLMTLIGFGVNWLIFRERKPGKTASGLKWCFVALVFAGGSNLLYAALTVQYDIQYIQAQLITAASMGLPHYVIVNMGVFKRKRKTAVACAPEVA